MPIVSFIFTQNLEGRVRRRRTASISVGRSCPFSEAVCLRLGSQRRESLADGEMRACFVVFVILVFHSPSASYSVFRLFLLRFCCSLRYVLILLVVVAASSCTSPSLRAIREE